MSRSADKLGAIMSLGCSGAIIVVVLGFPSWILLAQLNGGQLTGWAIIPCGVVTGLAVWTWMNRTNATTTARRPVDPIESSQQTDFVGPVHDKHLKGRVIDEPELFAVPKTTPKPPPKTPAGAANPVSADSATATTDVSGVRLIKVRVSDFRSLANIEVDLDELTVLVGANNAGKTSLLDALQFAIGANRRILGKEEIRLGKDEADVPKDRRAIVDILLRPIDTKGRIADTFPEGSFWTGLWGTGIAQDDEQNDMVAMRSVLEWSGTHGDYRTTRKFLREWKSFDHWQDADVNDLVSAAHVEPVALHYIDAKRDLEDDLRTRGSFWRRLTDDLGLSEGEIAELEAELSNINQALVDKSEVLKHLRENLLELKNVIAFDKAGIDIAPVPRHIRDLSRGVDVNLNSGGASAFPLTRHGMGTRSLASLLVFRAYALWRHARAKESGDEVHTLLALEEPEAHLHPQAQRALFAQIRDIPGQRIVSTHSPYFVAQSRLEDLRLLSKTKSDTTVRQLDLSKLSIDDRRKVEREVLASRGDLLFSRALILFEGKTEEQALAIFAESYWSATAHEKGFSFVGCGGSNYQPFVWLAEGLGVKWYILCDGDDKTVTGVNGQLKKLGLADVSTLDNCVVMDGKADYEGHLLNHGYPFEQAVSILDSNRRKNMSPSQQRVVIFDLETVPDLAAGRKLLKLDAKTTDEEVRRLLGERYAKSGENPENAFIKIPLQRIVCIGAIYADRSNGGPWTVIRSGVAHVGARSERDLVERFVDSLNEVPSPQLVGFNSSSFDLPVLRYRAFALAVPAPAIHGHNGKDYWYRYGRDHIDICDVISGFGASAKPSLAELAAISGIPAKVGGIDGLQVEPMVAAGRVEELAAYCDTDIFATYLLFLRFSLVTGGLNLEVFKSSLELLRSHVTERIQKRPHLQAFIDALGPMIDATAVPATLPQQQAPA